MREAVTVVAIVAVEALVAVRRVHRFVILGAVEALDLVAGRMR